MINDKLNRHIDNTNKYINNLKEKIKDIKEFNYHKRRKDKLNNSCNIMHKSYSQQNLSFSDAYNTDQKKLIIINQKKFF